MTAQTAGQSANYGSIPVRVRLCSVLGAPVPKCCPSVASVETGWAAGGFVSRMHVVERLREWDFCTDSGAAALRAFHRQRPAKGCDPVVQATEAAA
jgi:hypothetical protein